MKEKLLLQQGDTLYFAIPELPPGLEEEVGNNVVQHGEATGHAHRLHGDGFRLYKNPKDDVRYLRIVNVTALRHDEHKEIWIQPGDYRIGVVQEYDHFSEEARRVAD